MKVLNMFLVQAVENGNLEEIKKILEDEVTGSKYVDYKLDECVEICAERKYIDICDYLLSHGAKNVDWVLAYAAKNEDDELCEVAIKHNPSFNAFESVKNFVSYDQMGIKKIIDKALAVKKIDEQFEKYL